VKFDSYIRRARKVSTSGSLWMKIKGTAEITFCKSNQEFAKELQRIAIALDRDIVLRGRRVGFVRLIPINRNFAHGQPFSPACVSPKQNTHLIHQWLIPRLSRSKVYHSCVPVEWWRMQKFRVSRLRCSRLCEKRGHPRQHFLHDRRRQGIYFAGVAGGQIEHARLIAAHHAGIDFCIVPDWGS